MFSSRLPWNQEQNRFSQALAALRADGAPLLDLTESNPTRVGLFDDLDARALLAPLSDPRGVRYEPTPGGLPSARRAIADYYERRGVAVDPDDLLLCASTSEAYSWLFQLLCDDGDRVLYPQPSYPLLEHLAALSGVRLSPYPLLYEGRWGVDLQALRGACDDRTRAVMLVSPNNPTGSYLRRGELAALVEVCSERGLGLISDEVFGDYPLGPLSEDVATTLIGPAGAGALCFVLSGLSKVLGMPQLKLGWIHVSGPPPLRRAARAGLELIADTFLSVGTPVQLAAGALLAQQPALQGRIAARVRAGYALLGEIFAGTACQLLRADGGWYAVVRLPRLLSEEEWVLTLLSADRVVCYPGYFFDFPEEAYVVLSLLPEAAVLGEAARRIVERVGRL